VIFPPTLLLAKRITFCYCQCELRRAGSRAWYCNKVFNWLYCLRGFQQCGHTSSHSEQRS